MGVHAPVPLRQRRRLYPRATRGDTRPAHTSDTRPGVPRRLLSTLASERLVAPSGEVYDGETHAASAHWVVGGGPFVTPEGSVVSGGQDGWGGGAAKLGLRLGELVTTGLLGAGVPAGVRRGLAVIVGTGVPTEDTARVRLPPPGSRCTWSGRAPGVADTNVRQARSLSVNAIGAELFTR
jgi:hypothetical protein